MDQCLHEQLEREGYEVLERDGVFLLIDFLGQFVDSQHDSLESLREYCEKNVFTFSE